MTERVSDVVAGTQDVGNHELDPKGLNDIAYRLGDVDSRVKSLCEKQGNDHSRPVTGVSELQSGCAEIRLRQVEICRHRGDLCLLGNGGHQPLDAQTALGACCRGQARSARVGMAQSGQRVSRCGVCVGSGGRTSSARGDPDRCAGSSW